MQAELHERLKALDSGDDWEMPGDFDYSEALKEVVHHQASVEHLTGFRLSLDDGVQDASFFCELGNSRGIRFAIRFSAFDRMFTVHGTHLEQFEDLSSVIDYLTKQGYKYVAYADLMTPYDGKAKRGTEGWTWFTRFFDYL